MKLWALGIPFFFFPAEVKEWTFDSGQARSQNDLGLGWLGSLPLSTTLSACDTSTHHHIYLHYRRYIVKYYRKNQKLS